MQIEMPHNAGCFGQMEVSANRPNWDQFEYVSTISCTKSKLKGRPVYEKNSTKLKIFEFVFPF